MKVIRKYWMWIATVLFGGYFLWTRFHNIGSSMMFFDDMGRDSLVIWDWVKTGKPPLLGPQTSAMPFNQGPLFFYLLLPFFLISNFSPLSHLYLLTSVYIGLFILGMWCLREEPKIQKILLGVFGLICLHPQFVAQNRFVWNPSLVSPFLILGVLGLWFLLEKESWRRYLAWSVGMGVAVTLSYSVAPVMIACLIYVLVFRRKRFIKTFLWLVGVLFVLNLPMIAFEIRHGFLLTKSVLTVKGPTQYYSSFFEGLTRISEYTVTSGSALINKVIFIGSLAVAVVSFVWSKKNLTKYFAFLLLISTLMMLSMRLTIHAHYIFGYLSLCFLMLCSISIPVEIILVGIFMVQFGRPEILNTYFSTARRTYQQLDSCYAKVCDVEKDPLYVSTQADFHPYHNGPEHRYLLKKNGCDVKYIESQPDSAKMMAVILENSKFENGRTSYNELTLFGPAKELRRYDCESNIQVVIIEKEN